MENIKTALPGRIVPTGELRGALQPVRFGYLAKSCVASDNDEKVFQEGDHVALQYWGNGQVRVTVIDSHLTRTVHANTVQITDPPEILLSRSR